MACNARDLISRIRRAVHDAVMEGEGKPLYADNTYQDAVLRALRRVNIDLCAEYTLQTVTDNVEYLVELRAIIAMSQVRGAEGATSDVRDVPDGGAFMVQVPHLLIQQQPPQLEGTRFWRNLIAQLEGEYKEALNGCIDSKNTSIQQGTLTRTSLRTARLTERKYATPPEPTVVAAVLNGQTVELAWETIIDTQWKQYDLLRSTSPSFVSAVNVYSTQDNHDTTFNDTPGVGVWYYKVRVKNTNDLKADSNVVTVTVV